MHYKVKGISPGIKDDVLMKNITFTLTVLLTLISVSLRAGNIDSLQKKLDTAKNACLKVDLYTNIAANLIQFNMLKTHNVSTADAGKAIDYVLKAIHINSKNDDTLAIRNNFDCLGAAYAIQGKYTQAKWFILQSNYISRYRKDAPHIISSLIDLANIKTEIRDYKLAKKDLNEALVLSKRQNDIPRQIEVEKRMAAFYDESGNIKAATAMVSHYTFLTAYLQKARLQKYITQQKAKAKKHTTLQAKQISALQYKSDGDNKPLIQETILVSVN